MMRFLDGSAHQKKKITWISSMASKFLTTFPTLKEHLQKSLT